MSGTRTVSRGGSGWVQHSRTGGGGTPFTAISTGLYPVGGTLHPQHFLRDVCGSPVPTIKICGVNVSFPPRRRLAQLWWKCMERIKVFLNDKTKRCPCLQRHEALALAQPHPFPQLPNPAPHRLPVSGS